jgi:hypothetical protein
LLSQTLHQLQVQNKLLRHENEGLREAATLKQKHKQPSKALDLRRKESYHGGATFWSLRKMREARVCEVEKQQQEEAEIAVKANRKELQAAAKLLKEQEKKERRVAREEQKIVQERERAGKLAAHAARIKAQNTKKPSTNTQTGKRKASQGSPSNPKSKQAKSSAAAAAASSQAAPAPLPKGNTRGRKINLSAKYK